MGRTGAVVRVWILNKGFGVAVVEVVCAGGGMGQDVGAGSRVDVRVCCVHAEVGGWELRDNFEFSVV